MSLADRLADRVPEPEPVLTAEEVLALADPVPTDAALAAIAEAEAREVRRAMMQRFRL